MGVTQTPRQGKRRLKKNLQHDVRPVEAGMPLIDFLAVRLAISKRQAKDLLNSRSVFVNRRRVWMGKHELRPNDNVEVQEPEGTPVVPDRLETLFEDDDYVIVDKRPGMLSNGLNSVESSLRAHLHLPALAAAHRLDRDTSGCLLLAKSAKAFDDVLPLFRRHDVKKTYHVIAVRRVDPPEQTISVPVDGERAVTHLRTLDANREASHLQVTIDTGRTHQIRQHLDHIRHPVVGDRHYGTRLAASDKSLQVGRQMLHASSIEFAHPLTHRRVFAKAPLPRDFRNALRAFNLT